MTKAGDRIGAILATKDGVVKFLGFGTYLGEFIPDRPMGVTAWMIEADDYRALSATAEAQRRDILNTMLVVAQEKAHAMI